MCLLPCLHIWCDDEPKTFLIWLNCSFPALVFLFSVSDELKYVSSFFIFCVNSIKIENEFHWSHNFAQGCPGTPFVCNEGFLFNEMGRCVNGTQAPALLNQIQQARSLAASLDDIPSGDPDIGLEGIFIYLNPDIRVKPKACPCLWGWKDNPRRTSPWGNPLQVHQGGLGQRPGWKPQGRLCASKRVSSFTIKYYWQL